MTNVEFLRGQIEEIPLPSNSVDVIISNCVVNLSGDKQRVIEEAFRVLKPDGRFAVSDVVVEVELPADVKRSIGAVGRLCRRRALRRIDLLRDHIGATYHLGDLVGYAPWPNESVAALREAGIPGVAGNYDSTVATDYKHCGCKYEDARQEELSHLSYEWTRKHVWVETRKFLAGLPFRIDLRPLGGHLAGPTVTLIHGNQVLNTVYVHEERPDSFLEKMGTAMGARAGDIVCFGHTHLPWHRTVNGIHFVNTGSVGRPKDGDWRAGYALLDVGTAEPRVQFVRIEYDVERAAQAILESELPHDFAEYLRTGGKVTAAVNG